MTCRYSLGRYEVVSEVDFGKVTAMWLDYIGASVSLKKAGGAFATVVYDSTTGETIKQVHYRNEYMRDRCTSNLIDECEEEIKQ